MANTTRKKRRRSPFVRTILRLFFILLLLSMLVAYISNQVSISSRRAELQTLNEHKYSGFLVQIQIHSHASDIIYPYP